MKTIQPGEKGYVAGKRMMRGSDDFGGYTQEFIAPGNKKALPIGAGQLAHWGERTYDSEAATPTTPSWINGTPGAIVDRPAGTQASRNTPIGRTDDQEAKSALLVKESNSIQPSPLGSNRQAIGADNSDSLIKRLGAVLLR
jgi:hypothetical protein